MSKPPDPKIIEYFKKRGIVVEAMDTVRHCCLCNHPENSLCECFSISVSLSSVVLQLNATSTFNFLAGDGRYVAAALLTLEPATEDANTIARSYVSDTDKQDTYGA